MPIITKEIEVPSEPGLRVTIRRLSYWQVKQAKSARLNEVLAMSGQAAQFRDMVTAMNPEVIEAARTTVAEDPTQGYDVQTSLHAGIVAWSYPEDPKASNIDDLLGVEEADFIFREIVALTERSADEKKGWLPSCEPISTGVVEAGLSS